MDATEVREWPYPAVFAHRCGGTLAPENTLEGLLVARRFGAGVEFDVMLSRDATPLLIHDERLERTTSGYGRVADTPDQVLFGLDAGSRFDPRFAGARLPRFDEAAARCIELDLAVNIEIKPSAGQEERTAEAVAARARSLWSDSSRRPLLSSFSDVALRIAAEVAPELPRGLLVEALPHDWKARCRRLGVVAVHAEAGSLTAEQVRALRSEGLWVVTYTENDPVRASRLFEWGVDCIITDRPDLLSSPAAHVI